MRNLRRNKKPLYLCQKYQDGLLTKFKEPKKIYINYEPTTGDGDLISLGQNYPMFLKIRANMSEKDLFHPKDRLYIYSKPPAEHDSLCRTADYEVSEQPMLFINEVLVVLHRLSSDDEQ